MNEIPERIEREMFEIRNRMAPDVADLRKHVEPKVIGEQVKNNVKLRLRAAAKRAAESLKNKQREILGSAKRQLHSVGEAGKKRNPSPFTDAVKSDPRPLILLAIALAVTLFMARKVGGGEE